VGGRAVSASEHLSCDVAVVGSGFAGAIAARVLGRLGRTVALLERGRHPRFALGESSTPLAALALETLAARYDLPDLHSLAAYGRWLADFPGLRRGLKRGFTFFGHSPGRRFADGGGCRRRLLVAASPADRVADSHWLREDVDAFLVERAVGEGALYRDEVELEGVEERAGSLELSGSRQGRPFAVRADFLVDASGGRGFASRDLAPPAREERPPVATSLVYGHFEGVEDFGDVAREEGCDLPAGPYPDDRAAVHHLTDLGWMYVLPFDHGVASAGFLLDLSAAAARDLAAAGADDPAAVWQRLLARYPSLGRQFAAARPLRPIAWLPVVRHRLRRAAGRRRWLLLPSTFAFTDPLFSTGIAWSLAGVERLGWLFEQRSLPSPGDLADYAAVLAGEADQIDLLVRGAYLAMADFDLAAPYSLLYFTAVSFGEAKRRLAPERGDGPWESLLGSRDPVIRNALGETVACLEELERAGGATPEQRRAFADQIAAAIAPRNVAGLADPRRGNLYPVDFEDLVAAAPLLGMTAEEVRAALPRLRGDGAGP
jgi:tetracycline 7-halogenase / FADH2 O2-dependent halogenase